MEEKNTMRTAIGQHIAILKSILVYVFSNMKPSVSKDPGIMSKCRRSAFITKCATAHSLLQACKHQAELAGSILCCFHTVPLPGPPAFSAMHNQHWIPSGLQIQKQHTPFPIQH